MSPMWVTGLKLVYTQKLTNKWSCCLMVFNIAYISFQCNLPVRTFGAGIDGIWRPQRGTACLQRASGKNQILLTGWSCDWQSAAATRSVGPARSAGREITGRKTNASSYCMWLVQAGFNKEKANTFVITVAGVCASKWVVFLEMKTHCGVIWEDEGLSCCDKQHEH